MNDFAVYYILSVLAVYRVSHMIANEDGPVDVFSFIRDKAGQSNWIGRGLNCVLCISVWLSLIPSIIFFRSRFDIFILYWFAIAGGVLIIHKHLNKR